MHQVSQKSNGWIKSYVAKRPPGEAYVANLSIEIKLMAKFKKSNEQLSGNKVNRQTDESDNKGPSPINHRDQNGKRLLQ